MIRRVSLHEQKPGWMLALSLILHLLIFYICTNAALFRPKLHEAAPYYVDLVSLPSPDPSPAPQGKSSQPQTAPIALQPATPAPKPVANLPDKPAVRQSQPPASSAPTGQISGQEARDFAERMGRIEHTSEARHQAAALESLKRKTAIAAQSAAMFGTGNSSGSDYGAYIQSRLKDALATTIVYRSRQPETAIHLYIDRRGKLLRTVIVAPSTDKLFNDSVIRAIEKAKVNFPPPPKGVDFDKLYLFSPQEVLGK